MQIEDEKDIELTNNKIFELLDARFSRKYVLYEHLHNSYNKLVESIINYYYTNDNIFEENKVNDLVYRYRFKYENIYIRPSLNENGTGLMYPSDARDKSTTYTIKFIGKITQLQEIYDLNTKSIISVKVIGTPVEKETILSIPCMVRSKYCSLQISQDYNKKDCEYDPGGYFIVNGSEKYVLSLEKMVENKPLVFIKKDAGISSYKVKVNSKSSNPNIMMQGIEINLEKDYSINIKVPILNEVSVFVLIRALGLETDREIVKYIVYNENDIDMLNLLKISIKKSKKEGKKLILNKEDAYYSLTSKVRVVKKYAEKDRKLQYDEKKEHLEALLRNAFLPHINTDHYDDPLKIKAYFLCYMVNKLLNCYLGRTEPDDRDSFVNKRIDMPGDLIFDLFKQYYKKMLNDCNKFFKKRNASNHETPLNIINQIKPTNIEQGIKSAMMTGNWGKKKGVAQMYPRLTFLQSLSFLRRVDAPPGDSSTMKLTSPRHYHPSQAGFLCLTGDTEVLMSDGTVKLIKDVKNGDSVISVDAETMEEITTPIKNWFKQDCEKLLKITTISGRTIKCTPDHKFLTDVANKYEMVEIGKLKVGDNLIIRHSHKYIQQDETTKLIIKKSDIYEQYVPKLTELSYLDNFISQNKLEIFARLIGYYIKNGHISISSDKKHFTCEFSVNEEKDTNDLSDDIMKLGFGTSTISKNNKKTGLNTWIVTINDEFAYLLNYLGAFNCEKTEIFKVPEWIMNANKRIQREFISGFMSGNESRFIFNTKQNEYKIQYEEICQSSSKEYLNETLKYLEQISSILTKFNIKNRVYHHTNDMIEKEIKCIISINDSYENLNNYVDVINFRYCDEKRRKSTLTVEYIKHKNCHENVCLSYEDFIKNIAINENHLLMKIKSIEEITPEPVYDFETVYHTHSFVASSFVLSNCPVESPEHSNIGLVKHMALLSSICTGSNEQTEVIYNLINANKNFIHINNHSATQLMTNIKVFLNGEWIGLTDNPNILYSELRKLKQNGIIIRTNSIIYDIPRGEIKIYTDSGRLYRPLMTVKDNKILLNDKIINSVLGDKTLNKLNKWDALIEKYPETIDFVDMEEQYYMMVSEYKNNVIDMKKREKNVYVDSNKPIINRYDNSMIIKYTHCEFHPTMVIGIITGNIPFANHNHGPRNIFQYAQGRQALSIYSSNYRDRLDISYILYNVQKALVNTKISKYVHTDILPCGEQAVVAIACYTGHNQDDSIIFNQSSIDKGLFRSISLKKYISKVGKNQSTSQDDIFMKPDITKLTGTRHAIYDKLNDKGYVPEETHIENGDVIIGKVTPIQPAPGSNKCFKDSSEIYKSIENAIIDKVFTGIYDSEGYEMIKIRTRSERIPKIGDKFCCFDSEHDILTFNGWKKINKINLNDKIACLINGDTLEYKNPLAIQEYDYDGRMYKIKSNQIDLIVTPNHRMYVGNKNGKNYEIILAEDIYGKKLTYKKNVENYNPQNPIKEFKINGIDDLPDLIFDIELWLKFFGIWIAHGCIISSNDDLKLVIDNQKVKEILICIFQTMNIKHTIYKDDINNNSKDTFRITDTRIVKYFEQLEFKNKTLPIWIWNLTQIQSQILIDGILLNNDIYSYDTSSTQFADDFQRLCLHAGWSCDKILKSNTITSSDEIIESTKNIWRLTVITTQNNPLVNENINVDGTNRQDTWINFDNDELKNSIKNKVYCCSVPDDGVIYVRRNGYSVWCGQSRHGQKGTIGLTLSQSNMPFSEDGISPDLIINPQGIPSRMCVGHLLECLFGKAGALMGMEVDGTSFNDMDIEKVKDILEKYGYERNATEYLYNGMTGQKMYTPIFIGPTYYQRLKHLVMDKMHCMRADLTDVLTIDGWKKYDEFTKDDLIATLIDNKLVYEKPKEIYYYPNFNDKLYHISNSNIELDVTLEHRMWVSKLVKEPEETQLYDFEYAKDIIGKERRYKKDAEWDVKNYQFTLPKLIDLNDTVHNEIMVDMDAWITFFGVWMVDGCLNKVDDIIINVHKHGLKDILCQALQILSYDYSILNNEILKISDAQLSAYLKDLFLDSVNKFLPEWCFKLSKIQSQLLVNSMLLKNNDMCWNSTTRKLADQFQQLCLHAGFTANIIKHVDTDDITNIDVWKICVIKTKLNPTVNHELTELEQINEYIYNYNGPVFCLNVSSGVFLIRQNGKLCWTGNSRARGPITMLTHQPPEGKNIAHVYI